MGYRVAVVGATGNVGREMLNILEELKFPVEKIHAIASRKSIGLEVEFGDRILKCEDIAQFDFSTVDLVLMSVSGTFSKEWSPKIAAAGPIVIDNSSAWRMDPDVPLIVPEVNPDDVEWAHRKNIIANPNCSTAQLVVAM
jgi:aspartate-semialdehyde dehydrogenase